MNWKNLLKNSSVFLLFILLIGCTSELDLTLNEVSEVDAKYNIKLSDYQYGIIYFDRYIREINENQTLLNLEDYDVVIEELINLKEDKDERSLQYIDFRVKLLEAERIYLTARRKPFVNYKVPIRCSIREDLIESLNEVKHSIELFDDAVEMYRDMKFKNKLKMSNDWVSISQVKNEELFKSVDSKLIAIDEFCNQDQFE